MIIETIDENVAISTTVNDSLESNVNVINDGKPRVLFFYDICDDVSVNKLKELHESSRLFYDVNLITIGSAYGVSQNGSYLISTISDFVSDFKRDDIIYGVRETFSSPSSKGILQEY